MNRLHVRSAIGAISIRNYSSQNSPPGKLTYDMPYLGHVRHYLLGPLE